MSLPSKTVAIFGATGGTGLAVLKLCLEAGNAVNVLARSPSKLSHLSSQHPNLHVIQGDIRDLLAVKSTLTLDNKIVDIVVSSIGMSFKGGLNFGWNDESICEDATNTILRALSELEAENKPSFPVNGPQMVLLSTTGISEKSRDIPIAMLPLYRWMLHVPHEDKKKMEKLMHHGEGKARNWVLIRPSFLVDGKSKGMEKIRVSTETPGASPNEGEKQSVAIGYTISREDVGLWIFEECVNANGSKWKGKMVTLTY
jgi:nucleoside-diphosphate-sugar epimerase